MKIAGSSGDHEFQTREETADFIRKSALNPGTCAKDVAFRVTGGAPSDMPGNCVISLDEAIACVNQFFDTLQRPDCIEWREL